MQISHTIRGHGRWTDEAGRAAICEGTLWFSLPLSSIGLLETAEKIAHRGDGDGFCVLWQFTFFQRRAAKKCDKKLRKLTELMVNPRWRESDVLRCRLFKQRCFVHLDSITSKATNDSKVVDERNKSERNACSKKKQNHFRLPPEHAVDRRFLRQQQQQKSVKTFIFCLNWNQGKNCAPRTLFLSLTQFKGEHFHENVFHVFVCCVTRLNAIFGEWFVILLFMWENVYFWTMCAVVGRLIMKLRC